MKTNVIAKIQLEGIHRWEQAKDIFPEVSFLSYPHRHIFEITAKKAVQHNDRDIEIIMMGRQIHDYLSEKYGITPDKKSNYTLCNFDKMSCEMIAEELVNTFQLSYCMVLEDGENGAEVLN